MTDLSRTRTTILAALLTVLAFALGFAEFVLIGITPDVAEGLGEPITRIGDIVGYYALACAVATPVVSLATARANRLALMAALLVVFNAGNVLTLFADDYVVLLASRLLPAVTTGTLLAVALTYVPEIMPPKKVAGVLALVLAGFSVSSVVGVPVGTVLSDALGWKAAYACVLLLGAVASVALLPALPRASGTVREQATLRSQLRLLGDVRVLANVAMILVGAASTYVFYTYLTPVLEDVMGLDAAGVGIALLLFGAACVGSQMLSAWLANRFGLRGLPVTYALHAVLLALLAVSIPAGAAWGIADMLAVGLLMYAMNATVQMLFQNVARADYPSAVTFSASLHPMSFNAGIALGSFAGGIVVNAGGLLATGPAGALFALAAAALALALVRLCARTGSKAPASGRAVAPAPGETR